MTTSLILTGDPSHVTSPLVRTVTGLTPGAGGAIRVTTSAPHLFGPNDVVLMAAAPATGTYPIAIVSPTTFDLVGSTYTSTGTGTATDLSLTPQVQVPVDGATGSLQLSGILSTFQALFDRSQFNRDASLFVETAMFTGNGTWKAPPGVSQVFLMGCGGGGGGEAGCPGSTSTTTVQVQGGGGAGAPLGVAIQAVTPGVTYNIFTGSAGAGGTAPGGAGGDGGKTLFSASSPLVEFVGGQGAGIGQDVVAHSLGKALTLPAAGSTATVIFAPGGSGPGDGRPRRFPYDNNDVRVMEKYPSSTSATIIDNERYQDQTPGAGGYSGYASGIDSTYTNFPGGVSTAGRASMAWAGPGVTFGAYVGGSPGAIGANAAGPYWGGSGGGGGGGGGFGAGNDGGAGGNASTGTGAVGSPGTAGSANTGSGGGGGGVGGGGPTGGAGGAGGAGGTGVLYLFYFRSAR